TRATLHDYHLRRDEVNADRTPHGSPRPAIKSSPACVMGLWQRYTNDLAFIRRGNRIMERAFCRFAIQDLETMERPLRKSVWKIVPVFGAIGFLVAAGDAGGWFYYSFRLRDVPPLPRAPQALRSIAKIMAAPQPSTSPNTSAPIEPSSSPSNVPER